MRGIGRQERLKVGWVGPYEEFTAEVGNLGHAYQTWHAGYLPEKQQVICKNTKKNPQKYERVRERM